MQNNPTRTVATITAVIAAAAVGYTLRPSAQQTALAVRNPAVEVRTEVIRRTIHIVRHERARPAAGQAGTSGLPPGQSSAQAAGRPVAAQAVRTSTSHHAGTAQPSSSQAVAGTAPLRTSTSKHAAAQSTSGATGHGAPVTTRTSGSSSGGTGGSKPVRTRASAKGGEDGGSDGSDN